MSQSGFVKGPINCNRPISFSTKWEIILQHCLRVSEIRFATIGDYKDFWSNSPMQGRASPRDNSENKVSLSGS